MNGQNRMRVIEIFPGKVTYAGDVPDELCAVDPQTKLRAFPMFKSVEAAIDHAKMQGFGHLLSDDSN